ncbi:CRAL-TRIO domain-containing protein [Mycena indigotica]|uniref:CRAL-TRIO domain-containing protein n=1 Tax=Mycena indigotica TaxID=2126181 RepID=A0A8H6TFP8_9AGAR|nr:CRAL-TRIO domain-containing protein [Mycena indigotica]KAF7314905.1 CRAL-TRIO domain-containing protein [Mycena indigotica]
MASSADSPLAGHLGHLSPEQETKFSEFKLACTKEDLYAPGKTRQSLDEAALLRFLRARRFEVPDALHMIRETEAWRTANKLEELYDTLDVSAYEDARRVYHQWTGRRDLLGRPVYVYEISHLKNNMSAFEQSSKILPSNPSSGDAATKPIPGKLRVLFGLYENMAEFVLPLCTAVKSRPDPETPITSTAHIVDVSGVGLMGFWNLKNHMQAASTLASAHYPETLDRVYILGAPSFFPTVWGWIKRWFDPGTTSKIHVLSQTEVAPTLRAFMDPKDLPKKYGGELEWEYGMLPNLDGEILKAVSGLKTGDEWVKGPLRWVQDQDGSGKAKVIAKGIIDGKSRNEEVGVYEP